MAIDYNSHPSDMVRAGVCVPPLQLMACDAYSLIGNQFCREGSSSARCYTRSLLETSIPMGSMVHIS